ncbi:MAG TPA: hypothetical protein VLL54_22235 [Pyrinomonadaceae bacterium]|nr:hypothetical protein [Pyrinomonadaceae bacterium]
MKPTTLRFSLQRLFLLTLVAFIAVAALGIAVSARRASRAKEQAAQAANFKNGIDPQVQNGKQPNAPSAAVIGVTVTDNVTAATKVAPGANINYTAVVTNSGAASPADDATNLNFSDPLDANTTLVAGSVHSSPIAFNDTYNWVGNTQLDTAARALPAVTANDVAVNAPAGTDTFTVTAIAGGATILGGTVTLASPSGAFTYTPPLGRPNIADGATVQDSFTYTITNNVDPSLTATGTVRINLTGRVWYLQAGAAGDGRSNTPSSSPAAMSTAADKSTDVFYIFSNGASLNGPFSVDAGQQLLGQGVNLVVNAITLFTAGAAPTTTNTAGSCVALAGAPGNNTLSGFNIGNCTGGTAITGANVGTLAVSTMTINTNGGALDLTGVGAPTVSVVLGGTTSTGGARNVSLVGLNGTVTLAGGALSGATGNGLHMDGGTAGLTFSGTIQNTGARQVNVINKTGGTVALSGAIGGTGTGIFLSANNGATLNFTGGIALSTGTNDAFTATGPGPAATSGGTINVTQNNTSIVNTLVATTGSGLNITNTTIGASGVTFRSITSNGAGSNDGIILNNTGTTAGLTVTANGGTCSSSATCTGGTISNKTGGDGSTTQGSGIFLNSTSGVSIDRMQMNDFQNFGIKGASVTGFSFTNSRIVGINGTTEAGGGEEGPIRFDGLFTSGAFPTAQITGSTIQGAFSVNIRVTNAGGTLNRLVVDNCTLPSINSSNTNGGSSILFDVGAAATGGTLNFTISNSTISGARSHALNFTSHGGSHMDAVVTQNKIQNADTHILSAATGIILQGGDLGAADMTYNISCNKISTSAAGGAKGAGVILFKATNATSGTMVGTFSGNAIGVVGQPFSGAPNSAPGLWIQDHGAGTFTILIQNNTIVEYGEEAIDLQRTSGSSTMNASVFGNTVTPHSPDGFCGLNIEQGAVAADTGTMNLVVGNGGGGAQQNDFSNGDSANFSDIQVLRAGSSSTVLNLSKNGSVAVTVAQVLKDDNVNGAATNVFIPTAGNMNLVAGLPALPPAVAACSLPPIPNPGDDTVRNSIDAGPGSYLPASVVAQSNPEPVKPAQTLAPAQISSKDNIASVLAKATPKATASEVARIYSSERALSHHAVRNSFIRAAQDPNAPTSGENVTLNVIATFPAGKSITIKYSATVNTPPLARQVQTQATVTANAGAISVTSTDPGPPVVNGPTVTLVDTLMTWNGSTSTDWNTATNWTQPAGGTQYAPGVSNPAINDVVIPNVGAQPNISVSDIGIFSLNISNGRTLTITSPRVLTIGGSPGGDLTLDGIISGGNLNLGTGTHVINNAGGTGSLSSTNVATVLSGSTVTLNNNLQAGALAVNAGGSLNITNRTLSLNGSGPALVIPGGATFTTTGSTVVFNGTAAQQAAGIAYNNLTINNTIGLNVTGVTLTGNATVNGTLTLTSSDLDTGAFTLTQPNTTASVGVSDVVGSVSRTGGPFAPAVVLTFGNPNNRITFGAAGTKPSAVTVNLVKATPGAPQAYPAAVARTYTITKTGGTGFTGTTLRLHYLDSELGPLNATEASLNLRWFRANPPAGTGFWPAALPTTLDNTANWVECNAVGETDGPPNNNQFLASRWTFAGLSPTASNGIITGRITDNQGHGVEGAVVRLEGTQNRKFITDANGNYRFNDVETSGFYTVTPSRPNFTFSPDARSFSQVGESTQATFSANPTGETLNPLDTPEYFVRQHYIDFLGREPDEAGFNFWSDQILGCGVDQNCIDRKRENVSAAYFLSGEFQQEGALVDGLYRAGFGRVANYGEFMPDTHTVGQGVIVGMDGWESRLNANKEAFVNDFVNRPAFHAMYDGMENSVFVDTLLGHTGVSFTSDERLALLTGLTNGSQTRADVLRAIAENPRYVQAKFNETFVMMEYYGYLRRDYDSSGFMFWLTKLNEHNGNFEQADMVKAFIISGEYRDRFPR